MCRPFPADTLLPHPRCVALWVSSNVFFQLQSHTNQTDYCLPCTRTMHAMREVLNMAEFQDWQLEAGNIVQFCSQEKLYPRLMRPCCPDKKHRISP